MTAAGLSQRALTLADTAAAAAIHAQSFDTAWDRAAIQGHIERDLCWGLFNGCDLHAFAVLSVAADQADIITLAVATAQRRKGLGQALLRAVHSAARERDVEVIFLEVAIDNTAAIRLYKVCGYDPIGTRPAYYKRPGGRVAAQILQKALTASA